LIMRMRCAAIPIDAAAGLSTGGRGKPGDTRSWQYFLIANLIEDLSGLVPTAGKGCA
jgi:hypothetical protein